MILNAMRLFFATENLQKREEVKKKCMKNPSLSDENFSRFDLKCQKFSSNDTLLKEF